MIFRPGLADLVVYGKKTATRRATSDNPRSPWFRGGCKYRVGQEFAVQPGRGVTSIGTAIVDRVALERLDDLTDRDAVREGFRDAAAFFEAWRSINGAVVPGTWVWVIEFRLPTIPF